jgi:hypothetical protein
MAGRQRLMARKVAAIEKKSDELFSAFYKLMPELYRERLLSKNPLSRQPVCAAWGDAWKGASAAHKGLVALRKLLEERAAALPQAPACPFVGPSIDENHGAGRAISQLSS